MWNRVLGWGKVGDRDIGQGSSCPPAVTVVAAAAAHPSNLPTTLCPLLSGTVTAELETRALLAAGQRGPGDKALRLGLWKGRTRFFRSEGWKG